MPIDKPLHLFGDTRAIRIYNYTTQSSYVDFVTTTAGGMTVTPAVAAQTISLANTAGLSVGGTLAVTGASTLTGTVGIGGAAGASALSVFAGSTVFTVADVTLTHGRTSGRADFILGHATPSSDSFVRLKLIGSNAATNWEISSGGIATNVLTFTPSTAAGGSTFTTAVMAITTTGVFINDTNNANMTLGFTINQGANDNQALCLKSSDVATVLTSIATQAVETDDFLTISKASATIGGSLIQSLAEDGALTTPLNIRSYGGTADTTKTTAGVGLVNIYASEHNGANALADITANGNVFTVRARVGTADVTRLLVDEDGDLYSVTAAQTFDAEDDLALVRALDIARGGDTVREEWDQFIGYNEADLIRLGILGGTIADGGMTNVTQLQRLHNGALVQLHTENRKLRGALTALLTDDRAGALRFLEA